MSRRPRGARWHLRLRERVGYEDLAPQTNCTPLPNWRFTLGTGYQTRAVTGWWGSLSKVTGPYNTSIVTQNSTPLLDSHGDRIGSQTIAGAVTIKLTDAQATQASKSSSLWLQGGTPSDPVLTSQFGTPEAPDYGFGTLRCATDNVNGDNVEYVFFPSGTSHVFCYAYYVSPPPTSGTIIIHKQVDGGPAGANPSFPFTGDLSFDPNGFTLKHGQSISFYRAGGERWNVTEGSVPGYRLDSVHCTTTASGGETGTSTASTDGAHLAIDLSAGDTVNCTFVNRWVPPTGALTISKITQGGVGSFDFLVTPQSGGDSTLVRATSTRDGIPVDAVPESDLDHLAPGSYTVTERPPVNPPGGWTLTRVECGGSSRDTRDVTVTIRAGENQACTFTNTLTPDGAIHLSKVTVGGVGRTAFVIESLGAEPAEYHQVAIDSRAGVPADAVPDGDADRTDHIPLGGYRIIEQPPLAAPAGDWELTSVVCDGADMPFSDGSTEITLTRSTPRPSCRFTNTLHRHAAPDPEPTEPEAPIPPTTEPPATVPSDPETPAPGGGRTVPSGGQTVPAGGETVPPAPSGHDRPTRPAGTTPMPDTLWANLAIATRPVRAEVTRGHRITDRVAITNHGPSDAEGVVLDYDARHTSRLVSIHGGRGGCSRRLPIRCELGTLAPHHTRRLTIVLLAAKRAGGFNLHATVGTAGDDPRLSDNISDERIYIRPSTPKPPTPPVGCGSVELRAPLPDC